MITHKQLTLAEVFDDCQNKFDNDKYQFLQLLDEAINLDEIVPVSFVTHFHARTGRPRKHQLYPMLKALLIQCIFSIPTDTLLFIFLKYSQELRDFCGFDIVPDASKFTRFRQDFLPDLQSMFDHLVDLTEPICQKIDPHLAAMSIFDTSGIEAMVTENNPKYANRIIKQLKAFAKAHGFDENYDPYKLYATLNNLNQNALLHKIAKIILYDDIHTTSAWDILSEFTEIPVEHEIIERVKENKSLVDIRLTTGTCREFFQNDTDSFILASSDSDYWGLIPAMPEAHFLVLIEEDKCSPLIRKAMDDQGITYSYIDDFCTGNSNQIKEQAVLREVQAELDEIVNFNIQEVLQNAYINTRADMSTSEKKQFYERYIRPMRLVIDPDGEVFVELGPQ